VKRVALGVALILAACGGGQTGRSVFSTTWEDDGGKSIDAVRQRLQGRAIPAGVDVAVGVVEHSSKLVGQPLAGGARWTFAHALDARPIVTGSVVVASGAGDVFALDALTGKLVWSRPTGGLPLRGAGDDGTITVVTLGSAGAAGAAGVTKPPQDSTLLAVAHDGAVLRQIERPVDLGAPAVVDHLAFVPWDNQYVSVLDISSGDEVGRVILREKTSHAWTVGGAVYFGELGLFRFDDKIKDASRSGAAHLALPAKTLPGHPVLMRPGDESTKPIAGAADEIRLYARPTAPAKALGMDSGRFYATYFRIVFGLSPDAQVEWVHTHAARLIAGAASEGALVLCDADGKLTTLDARTGGQIGDPVDMGQPLESCVVQADGFHKAGPTADPGSLVEQIRVAVSDRDLELDAAQTMLLRQLATLPAEAATELLLRLAVAPRTPPAILEEVRAAIASRRTGARVLTAALEKHYDFLHDVLAPPPVGPTARALAAMNEKSAAPALASHLLDPADSDKDVRDVAQALVTLATPAEAPALLRFFALYHAAPREPEELPEAVNAVAEALLRVGGPDARAALVTAVRQPSTNPLVRARVGALIDAADAAQRGTPSTKPSSTSRE